MTPLRQRYLEDMQLRHLAPSSQSTYLLRVIDFAQHFGRSPAELGLEEVRRYLLFLTQEKKVSRSYFKQAQSALSFLYRFTLNHPEILPRIPYPRPDRKLPEVLSPDEVIRFLNAPKNLKHRTMLTTLYATGVRAQELVHLQVRDIDRARSHIRVSLYCRFWKTIGASTALFQKENRFPLKRGFFPGPAGSANRSARKRSSRFVNRPVAV